MNQKQETARVKVRDSSGALHTAIQYTTMVPFSSGGRTTWAKGSIGWRLADGRGLNTDDDRNFEDTDRRTYTLVD